MTFRERIKLSTLAAALVAVSSLEAVAQTQEGPMALASAVDFDRISWVGVDGRDVVESDISRQRKRCTDPRGNRCVLIFL